MAQDFAPIVNANRLGTNIPILDDRTDSLRSSFSGSAYPGSPVVGQLFFNITDLTLEQWDGAAWNLIAAKNTFTTSDPVVGDDVNDGYSISSIWFNTSSKEAFVCMDTTAGAAVWKSLTSATVPDIGCVVTRTGAQSISASTLTAVLFDAELEDTDGMHDNVTNNNRITFTTGGVYIFGFGYSWATGAGGQQRIHRILNNSGTTIAYQVQNAGNIGTMGSKRRFSATDWIEAKVQHNSSTNPLNFNQSADWAPIFWAQRIAA